jgi:hypothetical protein
VTIDGVSNESQKYKERNTSKSGSLNNQENESSFTVLVCRARQENIVPEYDNLLGNDSLVSVSTDNTKKQRNRLGW